MVVVLGWGMAVRVAGIALEEHTTWVACRTEDRAVAATGRLHHTVTEAVRTRLKGVHFQCSSFLQNHPVRLIVY